MKQFILRISENQPFNETVSGDDEIGRALQAILLQSPNDMLVGTRTVNNQSLVLVACLDIDDSELENLFDDIGVEWEVVAAENERIIQSGILPFMLERPVYDDDGDAIGSEPVTDLTGLLQTYLGRNWIY